LGKLRTPGSADNCNRLVLDTALANALAQRFYFQWPVGPRSSLQRAICNEQSPVAASRLQPTA
jgi:hypothetical protein